MKKSILAICMLIAFAGSAQLSRAHAQVGGLDLTVSPAFITLNALPGQTLHERFRVRNNLTQPLDLTITTRKLISATQNGQPQPADPKPEDVFISWITYQDSQFIANPKEWTDVNFTLTLPQTAAFGYYYVIQLAPTKDSTISGNGTAINGRILIPILLTVEHPGALSQAKLVSFTVDKFVNQYQPITFSVKVANTGNIHVKPNGNIFIRSGGDKDLAVLSINPGLGSILPQGNRTFTASWDDGFLVEEPETENGAVKIDKAGNPITHLQINWNKLTDFRFGKYTASLLLVYDTGTRDESLEATADFWIVPYTAIGTILISLLVVFLFLRFIIKLYIGRELKRIRK